MKTHLNLIPLATRRHQAVRRVTSMWSTAITAAAACCLTVCAVEWSRGVSAVSRLQSLDARFAPLSKMLEEQREVAKLIDDLRARKQLSLRLSGETPGVSLLGAVSTAAARLDGSVYVAKLNYEDAGSAGPDDQRLLLEGAGVDGFAVAAFAEGLREAGVFGEVTVDATHSLKGGAAALRGFQITCRL